MHHRRILSIIVLPEAALLLATTPFVVLHLWNLWYSRPHYQFFPLLVGGVAWLMWSRWPQWNPAGRLHTALRLALCGIGLGGLIASVLLFSPTLGMAAALLFLGALLMRLTGRNFRTLLPCWLLLWLIVPPPFRLDLQLIQSLQAVVSRASSVVFDVFGIEHLMSGNVLDLPGKRLLVEQACSGINSLLALLCAAALFVVAARRPMLRSALLILSAVGWALLVNLSRVVLIGIAHVAWQVDWSTGWVHDALGLVLVAIAFLLLVSSDYLLGWLLGDVGVIRAIAGGDKTRVKLPRTGIALDVNPFSYFWDRWVSGVKPASPDAEAQPGRQNVDSNDVHLPAPAGPVWSCLAVSLALLLFGAQVFLAFAPSGQAIAFAVQHLPFAEEDLPDAKWQVIDYRTEQRDMNSDEGALSNIWTVRGPRCEGTVSVDYPFPGWHELPNCYVGQGWDIVARRVEQHPAEEGGDLVEVLLSNPSGEHGYLLFSLFDADGRPLTPRVSHWTSLSVRLARNPLVGWALDETSAALPGASSFQVQLFVPTLQTLSIDERQGCSDQFLTYRQTVRRTVKKLTNDTRQDEGNEST